MTLFNAFKQLVFKKELPDSNFLVPLLIWTSGSYTNIQKTQLVNKRFFSVSKDLLMRSLLLNNKVKSFLKFPKIIKQDDKLDFFYKDVCRYYGWTSRELEHNFSTVDWNSIKEIIATSYAYDNKQRRKLNLTKIEATKNTKQVNKKSRIYTKTDRVVS